MLFRQMAKERNGNRVGIRQGVWWSEALDRKGSWAEEGRKKSGDKIQTTKLCFHLDGKYILEGNKIYHLCNLEFADGYKRQSQF